MTNKTKNAKEPLLTPEQWKLFGCVLALVAGVMGDSFLAVLMTNGIAAATAWNVVVLAVLAVLLLGKEATP